MIQKLSFCFSIFIFIGFCNYAYAQNREGKIHLADSILDARGEVIFSFRRTNLTPQIERFISVENIKDLQINAYANRKSFTKFLALNIDFQLLSGNFKISELKNAALVKLDSVYPSYLKYQDIMQTFENEFSSHCQLYNAGTTVLGRKLLILKISSSMEYSDDRPSVFLTSSMHGDELTGYKLLLWLSEYLLKNYGKDELVTKLMDNAEIWINPLANPDGTFFGGDSTVLQAKRFNANNIDLNRNFPDPDDGPHPDYSEWQPETIAMMNFYKQNRINLSANFHTGDEVVNYPWDTWSRAHADNEWYKTLSREYADLVHTKSNNSYMINYDHGIVNGYSWYRVKGGRQDYVNYFLDGREVTIELSNEGIPDSAMLTKYWNYNREALLKLIDQSLYGIQGKITDAESGLPIKAKVQMLNHDKDHSWVFSDSTKGLFHRLLGPGNYSMLVTSPGYTGYSKQFDLKVNEKQYFQVQLEPVKESVIVYPNPFKQVITLKIDQKLWLADKMEITLVDLTGKVLYKNHFSANKTASIHFPLLPDGFYLLELKSPQFIKQFKLMKQD